MEVHRDWYAPSHAAMRSQASGVEPGNEAGPLNMDTVVIVRGTRAREAAEHPSGPTPPRALFPDERGGITKASGAGAFPPTWPLA